ncbi:MULTISPECIES: Fe2+-dependent dioxygenase [unclassified Halomonas]|uniref:Fe2+-dependent dioxygenase n=1 Tax=unclassified Halomonas TaxID=2609666 RepID=UPI000C897C02|nr:MULTISPECIES: Fe2+-dependent dioxygenase [unclassified Halomonas]MAR72171.1 Fe2+-dependent dioxygenase [Halomonas sp.]
MILCIDKVLTDDQLQRIRQTLDASDFRDGRETAGWHARTVKRNQQASSQEPAIAALRDEVMQTLSAHTLFQIAARPRRMKPVMFSRYQQGMTYGNHVDDAVMPTPQGPMRTDLSFTIFLGDPDSYEGGELVTETTQGEQRFKLPAGSMILYPSSTLHRVDPVTQGERLAAVGWLQSQVRQPEQREVLFDLDTTRRQIFERDGKTAEFDSISKSLANLLRMWAEI